MAEEDTIKELERLRRENAALKSAPKGFQRDGMRQAEVLQISKALKKMLDEGEDEDVAYNIACREIVGVSADAFKRWKPDLLKLAKGEPTEANSMIGVPTIEPEEQNEKNNRGMGRLPGHNVLSRRVGELGGQVDTLTKDHERVSGERDVLAEQNAKLKEELENLRALEIGEPQKQGGELPPPVKKTK